MGGIGGMTKYKFPRGQIRIPACAGMTDGNGARTFAGIFYVSILILFLMRYSKKIGCAGCFYFSDDLKSTVVNPICFSNRLQPQNLPQSAPSPVGRAGERAFSKLRQPFPTTQPPKYKPCGLLPSLQPSPTGREDGEAVGVKGFVN